MRLAHFLARAGVASRRESEELVRSGLVQVNGMPVIDPAFGIEQDRDKVTFDGTRVRLPENFMYYLLHKPKGVTAGTNPHGEHKTIYDLVPPNPRVFAVGRLEEDAGGLLLLTDDDALSAELTGSRNKTVEIYHVIAEGRFDGDVLKKLNDGIHLYEGKARARFSVVKKGRNFVVMNVTITQGIKRQVNRMLAKAGLKAKKVLRTSFGPFSLKGLPVGAYFILKPDDVRSAMENLRRA